MTKKVSEGENLKRILVRTTIEMKNEIIVKHENGICVSDVALQYSITKSLIYTILKKKGDKGS